MRYPKHSPYVRLRSRFKCEYLWSKAPRSFRVHIIDHAHSMVLYDKRTQGYKVIVRLLCESSVALANRVAGNEVPADKVLCTMCHTVKETGRPNPWVRYKW